MGYRRYEEGACQLFQTGDCVLICSFHASAAPCLAVAPAHVGALASVLPARRVSDACASARVFSLVLRREREDAAEQNPRDKRGEMSNLNHTGGDHESELAIV
eukprot:6182422-Pleurochrysis_carterae.AAC.4